MRRLLLFALLVLILLAFAVPALARPEPLMRPACGGFQTSAFDDFYSVPACVFLPMVRDCSPVVPDSGCHAGTTDSEG